MWRRKVFFIALFGRRHPDTENKMKKCQYYLLSRHANKKNSRSPQCLDTSRKFRGHGEFDGRKEHDEGVGSAS